MPPRALQEEGDCQALPDPVSRHMTGLTADSHPRFAFSGVASFEAGAHPTLSGHPWAEPGSSLGMRLGAALPLR